MGFCVKRVRPGAALPQRATAGSAGYDLRACLEEEVTILPGQTVTIPTGLAIDLGSPDRAAFIFARSGLGIKHGVVPGNCVGVIDSDYRGAIQVGLVNLSDTPCTLEPGERVAQLMVMPVARCAFTFAQALDETERGEGGFGSTGRL